MNTIVVATDFSPSADNAMLYAASLAGNMNASLLLVNVFQIPVSMGDVPVMIIPLEELKQQVDNNLERSKELVKKSYQTVVIETESRMGDVNDELKDVCAEKNALLIVAGKHGMSGVEKVFFGNTTLSIINHSKVPVLTVPDTESASTIQNAVVAIDLSEHSEEVIQKTRHLVQRLGCQLHVIHIKNQSEDVSVEDLKKIMPEENAVYRVLKADDFSAGIQSYVSENNIDLLISYPHHRNLMERLFFKTHTAELVDELNIPMLSIRD
jgi:nucleotide-binding universal stress UspA family protein